MMPLTGVVALSSVFPAVAKDRQENQPKKPMNIIYILSDDHSYQTISAYDHRFIETPNIDWIANHGCRFTNSFVANSLSGPSRACMLTGKHSHANGFTDNTRTFDGSQQTYPKLLQKAGYETAIIGKWHLTSDPTGFNYWDILVGQGDYYNPDFVCNGKPTVRQGYVTNIITDVALDWLSNKRDKNKPFCLLLHHKAPHRVWNPDTCDLDLYNDKTYPLPDNFYDDYSGREAAKKQKMNIMKDMDIVYDCKMADHENEIHSNPELEAWGRKNYARMTPSQREQWDKHYDPIIEKFKKDKLSGKALAEWKYQRYMHDCWFIYQAANMGTSTRWYRTSTMRRRSLTWQESRSRQISKGYPSSRCWRERRSRTGGNPFTTIIMNIRQSIQSAAIMACAPPATP